MNIDRIAHDFSYHAPTAESVRNMQAIRDRARDLAHVIDNLAPDCREKSLAITKLEEVVMWANAGIARNQPIEVPGVVPLEEHWSVTDAKKREIKDAQELKIKVTQDKDGVTYISESELPPLEIPPGAQATIDAIRAYKQRTAKGGVVSNGCGGNCRCKT